MYVAIGHTSTSRHCLAFLILSVHAGLVAFGAWRCSPTFDETGYLPSALRQWTGDGFDACITNPPLVRWIAAFPVGISRHTVEPADYFETDFFALGRRFIERLGSDACLVYTYARFGCIAFSLLGGLVCYRWAYRLHGRRGAILALLLWCLCPNIIAHAQLITPDVGVAALGACATYSFYRWLVAGGWPQALIAGVILGMAQLTKMTWLVFYAIWPLLWLAWNCAAGRQGFGRRWKSSVLQLLAIMGGSILVVNLAYGFEGSFERLAAYRFESAALRSEEPPGHGSQFSGTWLGCVPVPLPARYVAGLDRLKAAFETPHRSYLRGEWKPVGWWYYYLYALAIKVPIGTWLLVGLRIAMPRLPGRQSPSRLDQVVLLAPAMAVLVVVSSQTGFNHHLRYVLPALPFFFIWVSGVAQWITWRTWRRGLLVTFALAWSVMSSLWHYPHCLSYFNEFAGGPMNGHAHLVDSNIDWGQDLLFLRDWVEEHPEARPLGLAYFGNFDPTVAGIAFSLPPAAAGGSGPWDRSGGPAPGWYAVSVNFLRGYQIWACNGRGGTDWVGPAEYTYFQGVTPVAMAGYSIYIYHLDVNDANRLRSELGLPPLNPDLELPAALDDADDGSDPS